tara:strand:- start:386 stop:937 length:552 start_codon:yes stop_codon:yes gene_type:complete
MIKIILFFFFLLFNLNLYSSEKDNIIDNFKKIKNLSFDFKQTINGKTESGKCIIEYPKKINCSYDVRNNKKLVSNGKSLVIVNKNNQYYHYALERTPFQLLLDKKYILNQMKKLKGELVSNKYYKYSIKSENNEINIFFNKKNYQIIGWQTEDIYQNLVVTYIYNLKTNNKINKDIFRLPERS